MASYSPLLPSATSARNGSSPARPRWPYYLAAGVALCFVVLASHRPATSTLHKLSQHPAFTSAKEKLVAILPAGDPLAYRHFLEETTSPTNQIVHSPTLGFSKIYVLSLPTREDRREQMRKLASALGVEITFVDAAHKDEPFIKWIGERVAEVRGLRARMMAKARKTTPDQIGGLAIGSDWLSPTLDHNSAKRPGKRPFPAFPSQNKYIGGNWAAHLEALHSFGNHTSLRPSDPNINITQILRDPLEVTEPRQLHEGIISTWWGQSRVAKQILEDDCDSALVMEDDVDVEWDLERMWSRLSVKLPEDWRMVMLGHCWSHEIQSTWFLHPRLHPAVSPMCLHGWAVSRLGAINFFEHLTNPWHAFSTAVDLVVPSLLYHGSVPKYSTFSIQPPLIIQRKDSPSSLQKGTGSKWRGVLGDSTVERIKRDEGTWRGTEELGELFDEDDIDIATAFRERTPC